VVTAPYAGAVTSLRFTVTEQDTAIALGSGDVPVLATPRVLAWMEQASVVAAAQRLDPSSTSVGVEAWVRHRRASAVGAQIEVEVTQVVEQDRGVAYTVVVRELPRADLEADAAQPGAREVATGRIVRAVVDRAAFLSRL
jgi:predicted thioesterase